MGEGAIIILLVLPYLWIYIQYRAWLRNKSLQTWISRPEVAAGVVVWAWFWMIILFCEL